MVKDILVGALIFIAFCFVLNGFNKDQMRRYCETFSRVSGRSTEFVEYTNWSYDCIAIGENGLGISAFNLRSN